MALQAVGEKAVRHGIGGEFAHLNAMLVAGCAGGVVGLGYRMRHDGRSSVIGPSRRAKFERFCFGLLVGLNNERMRVVTGDASMVIELGVARGELGTPAGGRPRVGSTHSGVRRGRHGSRRDRAERNLVIVARNLFAQFRQCFVHRDPFTDASNRTHDRQADHGRQRDGDASPVDMSRFGIHGWPSPFRRRIRTAHFL